MQEASEALGAYLKRARSATGLTLRAVESQTSVTNGYLSQIENGMVQRPSPNTLFELATVYGLDYGDLMSRAGHRQPMQASTGARAALNGIPLNALEDLDEAEQRQLLDYLAFLKSRRDT